MMKKELAVFAAPSAQIPSEVPALPKGHVPRKSILGSIKRSLFALLPPGENATLEGATLLVQGMGGSGKTVIASSIARDLEVATRFRAICFVGVGQDADLVELRQ